ncbi:MAG: hypothetical protein ACTJLK_02370 [Anaplasma sp.]
MLEKDGKKVEELVVPPFQGVNSWVDSAKMDNAMDPALSEALVSMATVGSKIEEKAAEVAKELRETSKESTQEVTNATTDFFGKGWLGDTLRSISNKSDALGADLEYLLLPDGRYGTLDAKREAKELGGIDGERLERVSKLFRQALEESGDHVDRKVQESVQKVLGERDKAHGQLDKDEGLSDILGTLADFRNETLSAIHNVEDAVDEGIVRAEGGFRTYRDDVRGISKDKGDQKELDVSQRLSDFRAEMSEDIQEFRGQAAPEFKQARATARSLVGGAMKLVGEQELGEVFGVHSSAMVAADRVRSAFGNLCSTAKEFLYEEGPKVIGEVDKIINDRIRYKIHDGECNKFVVFTTDIKDHVHDGLSGTAATLSAAQQSMDKAVISFEKEIRSLTEVSQLDQLASKLTTFQQETVKIIGGALKAVKEGRQAVLDGAEKFEKEALRVTEGLLDGPKGELKESLEHFKETVAELRRGVEVKALGELKAMIKLSDKEMRRAIADIPYKALSGVPYKGVAEWIEDAKAGRDMDSNLAESLKELDESARATETGIAAAIRSSNEAIANAFRRLAEAIRDGWAESSQKVIDFFEGRAAKDAKLLQQWEETEKRLNERATKVNAVLDAAGRKVDAVLEDANRVLDQIDDDHDLDTAKEILESFRGQTTEALGAALSDIDAEYIDMERELAELGGGELRTAMYPFTDALRNNMQGFGMVVEAASEEVETVIRDPFRGIDSNVVPFKGVGQWVEGAQQEEASMDPALEQALTIIAEASGKTEERGTAEAAKKLRETSKESTAAVARSTSQFFQNTVQWFVRAHDSVSRESDNLYKVLDAARKDAKAAGGWQGERMERAHQAFKQALKEQRGRVENTASAAAQAVNDAVLAAGNKLDNAQSMQEVLGALTDFRGATLRSIDDVERNTDRALSDMGSGFTKFQREASEDVIQSGVEPGREAGLRNAIKGAEGEVASAIASVRDQLTAGVIGARLTEISPVARAMEIVAERELQEVKRVWATAVVAGDKVDRGFSNMCSEAVTYLINRGAGLISGMDDIVARCVNGLNRDEEAEMRRVVREIGDAVVQKCSTVRASVEDAQDRMSKAVGDLYEKIRDVRSVDQLESVKDLLEAFQRESILIMGDALQAVRTGREGITEEVNRFEQEARRLGDDLDPAPKRDVDKALQALKKEVKDLDRAIETKGLGQLKSMVNMADKAMRGAIADMPYKALASVPFKGTKQWLRDARSEKKAAALDPELRHALETIEEAAKASETGIRRALRICGELLETFFEGIRESWDTMLSKVVARQRSNVDNVEWQNEMNSLWGQVRGQVRALSGDVAETLKQAEVLVNQLRKEAMEKAEQATLGEEKQQILEEFRNESSKIMANVLNTVNEGKEGLRQYIQQRFVGANDNEIQEALQEFEQTVPEVLNSLEVTREQIDLAAKEDPDLGFSTTSVGSEQRDMEETLERQAGGLQVEEFDNDLRSSMQQERVGQLGATAKIDQALEQNPGLEQELLDAVKGLEEGIKEAANPQQRFAEQEQEAQQQRGGGRGR